MTAEQLEARRAYIGGTDAAALAGVNPPSWAQPIDVYLDKRGLAPERQRTSAMSMGAVLEPVVAQLFTEATGIRLRRPARPVHSRRYPWAGGNLDRWAADGLPFEAKWAMRSDEWGPGEVQGVIDPEYRPLVPLRYAVQVQHYLAVTGRPAAYLAVLLGYGDFRWYALDRDDELIARLMELEERFWVDHVVAGVPPEPDGSPAYGQHLRRTYPTSDESEVVATPEQQAMLGALRLAREEEAGAALRVAALEQRVQESMGTHGRLVAPGATVTWRQTAPRLVVRWEELALRLLRELADTAMDKGAGVAWPTTKKGEAEYVREVARAHGVASEEPGTRPFRVVFDSDEAQ